MRYVFPDNGDRIVYSAEHFLRAATGVAFHIFADPGATVLADIQTAAGDPISDSVIVVDEGSMVPEFLGPDDRSIVLYARQVDGSGPISTIQAKASSIFQRTITVGSTPPPSPFIGELWVPTS